MIHEKVAKVRRYLIGSYEVRPSGILVSFHAPTYSITASRKLRAVPNGYAFDYLVPKHARKLAADLIAAAKEAEAEQVKRDAESVEVA